MNSHPKPDNSASRFVPKDHSDDMDYIDYQILELLRENSRISAKDISEKVFLSSTSVATRIERMIKMGVIAGFEVKINPHALGYYTKAFINVEVDPCQKKEFYPYIDKCANVIQCNCVTGEFSMLLEVMFHNTIELDYFIGELQRFGKTKTLIVFSTSVEHRETYWQESTDAE